MLKQSVKYLIVLCLYYSGVVRLFSALRRVRVNSEVVLLGYHRVLDLEVEGYDYSQTGLVTSIGHFKRQIKYMLRRSQAISVSRLSETLDGTQRLPEKCFIVALDGWRDTYERAFPIIRSESVPAVVLLTTDLVGTRGAFWHTKLAYVLLNADLSRLELARRDAGERFPGPLLAELKRLGSLGRALRMPDIDGPIEAVKWLDRKIIDQAIERLADAVGVSLEKLEQRAFLLNWDQAKEMAKHAIEFGSHSSTHRILTTLPAPEAWSEISDSKKLIEDKVGAKVHAFACPDGHSNDEIQKLVLQAGYTIALYRFNERDEWVSRQFVLRRVCIHDGMCSSPWGSFSRALFAFEVSGVRSVLK